jgi:hypothetical protein
MRRRSNLRAVRGTADRRSALLYPLGELGTCQDIRYQFPFRS